MWGFIRFQTPDSSIDTKIDKMTQEEIKTQEDIKTTNDDGEEIEGEGEGEGEGEEEEEECECGFCLFMKGGGCKESFVAWENCVELFLFYVQFLLLMHGTCVGF